MLQRLLLRIIDQILPPRCAGCGRPGSLICSSCRLKMPAGLPPLCLQCGLETNVCRCRSAADSTSLIHAPYAFAPPLTTIIHAFKYSGQFGLALPLAELMSRCCSALDRGDRFRRPVLVPIPLHVHRQRERGYNQSGLLAGHLSQICGWPVARNVLVRQKATQVQARLSASERRQNVSGAFKAEPARLPKGPIMLIDDVCTTGSTLKAAAAALAAAGAGPVNALCVARAAGRGSTITSQLGKNK